MVRALLKQDPMRLLATPALLALLASGCVFYAGDDDDDPCKYGGGDVDNGGAADPIYDPGQRNPDTGQCEYFGGGGGGGGGGGCDACGNCPPDETDPGAGDAAEPAPTPTWGYCESACTGLDEATCVATSACRAIYVSGETVTYADCWSVDQTGPIQGGGCDGLDATTCSMHSLAPQHANSWTLSPLQRSAGHVRWRRPWDPLPHRPAAPPAPN